MAITGEGAGSLTGVLGGVTDSTELLFTGVGTLTSAADSVSAFVLGSGAGFHGLIDGRLGSLSQLVFNTGETYGTLDYNPTSALGGQISMASTPSILDFANLSQVTILQNGGIANINTGSADPSPLMETTVGNRVGPLGLPLSGGLTNSSTP